MEKKEIKLNHFNIYAVIAIIALIYFSIKCIQFYFEMGVPKEIWETIIVKKTIFISNEKNISTKLLENLLFLLLVFTPPLLAYLFVKKIYKICNYFLSEEKIIISDEHFYYTRKLTIINFEKFKINLKEGIYYIETNNLNIVAEKLKFTLNKNMVNYFEITENDININESVFIDNEYRKEILNIFTSIIFANIIFANIIFSSVHLNSFLI